MPTDVARVKELFLAVLDLPAPERTSYLETACAGDSALRQQIEAMLSSHQNSGELLPRPAGEMLADTGNTEAEATAAFARSNVTGTQADNVGGADHDLSFLTPATKPDCLGQLGHYTVQNVIGKGGFGIVLKAFDERLHRVVALKVLSPAYAANGAACKRFIREARTAAAVKNEHVVGIYDVEEDALSRHGDDRRHFAARQTRQARSARRDGDLAHRHADDRGSCRRPQTKPGTS
jgi:hypothetical protein